MLKKKDLNSCEEFMELITTAHILSAAMGVAEVEDLQGLSRPHVVYNRVDKITLKGDLVYRSSEHHLTSLTSAAKKVCSQFCKVTYCNEA